MVVPDDAILAQEIACHVPQSHGIELLERRLHWFGALLAITTQQAWLHRGAIDYGKIEKAIARVVIDGPNMIGDRVVLRFAGLRHQVGNVDARCPRLSNDLRDFLNQQIGDDARIERARPYEYQVSFSNRRKHLRKGANAPRDEPNPVDAFARARNIRFAGHNRAVRKFCLERHILLSRRKYSPADRQNARRHSNSLGEVSRNVCQRRKKEIAEAVTGQAAPGRKPVLEEIAEQRFILRKCHHAVAYVAGRKNSIFAPQAAGASAIVRHSDDRCKVRDGPLRAFPFPPRNILFEASKDRRETCPTAEGDDPNRSRVLVRMIFHVREN